MGQWNRIKAPKTGPHIYGQLVFSKDANVIQWGKKIF